jgi:hemerythrin-like domain-containing protein
MVIEETIFYPAVRRVKPDLVLESYEEHAIAQVELKRMLATDRSDPRFEARATALLDLIKHHVEEEEEELFPRVEKALDDEQLESLGKQLDASFKELVERGHEAVLGRAPAAKATGDRQSKRIATETAHAG